MLVEGELIAPDLELPWKMTFVDPLQAFRELFHANGGHMVVRQIGRYTAFQNFGQVVLPAVESFLHPQ